MLLPRGIGILTDNLIRGVDPQSERRNSQGKQRDRTVRFAEKRLRKIVTRNVARSTHVSRTGVSSPDIKSREPLCLAPQIPVINRTAVHIASNDLPGAIEGDCITVRRPRGIQCGNAAIGVTHEAVKVDSNLIVPNDLTARADAPRMGG